MYEEDEVPLKLSSELKLVNKSISRMTLGVWARESWTHPSTRQEVQDACLLAVMTLG